MASRYEGEVHDKLGSVFHDVAHLFGVTDGKLTDWSREHWFDMVRNPSPQSAGPEAPRLGGADRPLRPDHRVREGALPVPPRYFTDYLTFVKLAEGWRIVSKTFHTETR